MSKGGQYKVVLFRCLVVMKHCLKWRRV